MIPELHCGRFRLRLDRPLIMGIVNCTPDSFSGDGVAIDAARAVEQGRHFIAEGADILDIGGESSRPGAAPVPEDEELRRVLPVIEALRDAGVPLSVDTVKPTVMRAGGGGGGDHDQRHQRPARARRTGGGGREATRRSA